MSANAQRRPGAERELSFTVFSAEPVANLSYMPQPDAPLAALTFYPTARSPHYTYRGPSLLQFCDEKTGKVVAEITVPPGIRTALFILSAGGPAPSGEERYRIEILDDDPSRLGPGTLLVLNFSGLELTGTLNLRPVSLQAGANGPFRVDAAATINLRTPFRGRSYQAYSETIPLDHLSRGLLLLLPPYRTGSLEVQSRVLLDHTAPPASGPER